MQTITTGPKNSVVEALRANEVLSYQIAYYLLENSELACLAARKALLEAGQSPRLCKLDTEEQSEFIRKLTIRNALSVKKQLAIPQME